MFGNTLNALLLFGYLPKMTDYVIKCKVDISLACDSYCKVIAALFLFHIVVIFEDIATYCTYLSELTVIDGYI